METKVYGRKPSYKYLKDYIKKYNNNDHKGVVYHVETLVYYTIKHDFTEEQAKAYFNEQMNHCEKLLKNSSCGIYHYVAYKIFKDVLNIDPNNFKLEEYISYNYNYDKRYYDEDDIRYSYNYSYKTPSDMHKTLFRDYNEHTVYLYDIMDKHGYYNNIINFNKIYDNEGTNDYIRVEFRKSYNAAGHNCSQERLQKYKDEFAEICLCFWHFIKLLDCIEHPNDIDINELSKRKEIPDKVQDNREWQIKNQKKIQYIDKQKEVKTYKWKPILKCIEEIKNKVKSLLK